VDQNIVQYCENCGKPLNVRSNFCGRCGLIVQQQAPAPAMPPPYLPVSIPQPIVTQQPEVTILAALPIGTQRSGFMGVRAEGFVLVITNLGILVAQQTSQIMQENTRQAKETAKQSGKGFFGQWGAMLGSNNSQRYLQLNPQAILNETAGNYFIANNQIRSVKIKENYDPEDGRNDVKLTFDTVSGKMEFSYTQISKKELKKALQQTLGNLVR
jgi:hypothetical protein